MTKEEYLVIRNRNPSDLIYKVYGERWDATKHGKFLDVHTMLGLLNVMTDVNQLLTNLLEEHDKKFNIMTIRDKDGKFIKAI